MLKMRERNAKLGQTFYQRSGLFIPAPKVRKGGQMDNQLLLLAAASKFILHTLSRVSPKWVCPDK